MAWLCEVTIFPLQPILLSALWYLKGPLPSVRRSYTGIVLLRHLKDLITFRKHLSFMLAGTTPPGFMPYAYLHDSVNITLLKKSWHLAEEPQKQHQIHVSKGGEETAL